MTDDGLPEKTDEAPKSGNVFLRTTFIHNSTMPLNLSDERWRMAQEERERRIGALAALYPDALVALAELAEIRACMASVRLINGTAAQFSENQGRMAEMSDFAAALRTICEKKRRES